MFSKNLALKKCVKGKSADPHSASSQSCKRASFWSPNPIRHRY